MATIEERLATIEHEHEELKHKIELQTIAIGALVTKATLEQLNEKHDKIFDALIAHDQFISQQLAEIREKVEVQAEGKIVGLQTVVRQGFEAVNTRFEQQDNKIAGLQTEVRQGFEAMNARFERQEATVNARFEQQEVTMNARFEQQEITMNARFEQQEVTMNARFEQHGKQLEAQGKQIETLGKQMEQVLLLLNTLTNKPE